MNEFIANDKRLWSTWRRRRGTFGARVAKRREEQRLGLEIARLQNEQHPTCQAVVAIGHRTFFRREGEIVDALIVREPRTAVELFDLGVFENRDTVLVSSGHGWSLFLRGHGTHLFVHRADADPEAERHVLDANFGGL
jgi:hypothetical protein